MTDNEHRDREEVKKPEWQQRRLSQPRKWQSRLIQSVQNEESLRDRALDKLGNRETGIFNVLMSKHLSQQSHDAIQRQLIEQLYHSDLHDRERRVPLAHHNTFQWLFKHKEDPTSQPWASMTEWLQGNESVYWITGKAGSGKSTLMKYICNNPETRRHLEVWAERNKLILARFYLWNSGSPLQMSLEGMLRSIVHDALSQKPSMAENLFPERWHRFRILGGDVKPLTLPELTQAFDLFCRQASAKLRICLFIDGMDEFDGDPAELIELLQGALRWPYVKACLASRPWPVFADAFSTNSSLMLQHLTKGDILNYATDKLCNHPGYVEMQRRESAFAARLIETLATRSEGVFLWVSLVIRSLMTGLSNSDRISDLQKRLDKLPSGLEELYQRMFDSIDPFYAQRVYHLLAITRVAQGSMNALVLSFADEEDEDLAIRRTTAPMEDIEKAGRYESIRRRLQGCCKGFLEISDSENFSDMTENRPKPNRDYDVPFSETVSGTSYGRVKQEAQKANGKVAYLHRTARDFLNDARIASIMSHGSSPTFSAQMSLVRGYILALKTSPASDFGWANPGWDILHLCMTHASMLERNPKLFPQLSKVLDTVDVAMSQLLPPTQSSSKTEHWTERRPGQHAETGFLAFVSEYRLQSYINHKINEGSGIFEVEKKYPLLYYASVGFQEYQALQDLSPEFEGIPVPSVSVIRAVLDSGADPNEVLKDSGQTIWSATLAVVVQIPKQWDLSEELMISVLKAWALVIMEFILHSADPRVNRNSPVASCIREAFGALLPDEAKKLEKSLRSSKRRLSALGKLFLPPSKPTVPPSVEDVTPLSLINRWEAMRFSSPSFTEWLSRKPRTETSNDSLSSLPPLPAHAPTIFSQKHSIQKRKSRVRHGYPSPWRMEQRQDETSPSSSTYRPYRTFRECRDHSDQLREETVPEPRRSRMDADYDGDHSDEIDNYDDYRDDREGDLQETREEYDQGRYDRERYKSVGYGRKRDNNAGDGYAGFRGGTPPPRRDQSSGAAG